MRVGLLVGLLMLLVGVVHAQNGFEDVVYLKNGSIIRGMIMEQTPNVSLKIETVGRNLLVFKMEEVEKITKEPIPGEKQEKDPKAPSEKTDWDRGRFTFMIEGNLGFGNRFRNNGTTGFGLLSLGGNLAFDVNITPKFCLGLGAGYDGIDIFSFIPVFLDTRYFFSEKPVTPFISAGLGYSIGPAMYDEGGWYANPNLGLRCNFARKSALTFGLGWRLQTEKTNNRNFYTFSMLNLKVGAMF